MDAEAAAEAACEVQSPLSSLDSRYDSLSPLKCDSCNMVIHPIQTCQAVSCGVLPMAVCMPSPKAGPAEFFGTLAERRSQGS